ncbi:MAG: MFS transporter [Mycobacterium leprae]
MAYPAEGRAARVRFPSAFRSLNHPDYRLFFFGQLISQIGTWMQRIGQSWLIMQLTRSAFLLGLITTLQFLPILIFAIFGGALADRLPKRRTMIFTQSAMALQALILAALVWSHRVQYWHVAVLALLLGLTNTLDTPVMQAFTVDMVGGREDLRNAIALNSATNNGARLLGPALSGLLVAHYGVALAFFLNGVSFLAVISALLMVRAKGMPAARRQRKILQDVGEGLLFIYRTPLILFLNLLLLVIGMFVINWSVLIAMLASGVLGLDAQGYGMLMSALGAGALVGAVAMAAQKSSHKVNINPLIGAGLALCLATGLMYFVHNFWLALADLALMGLMQILYTADTNSVLQLATPDGLQGRVMSVYQLVFAGVTPFGALFTGTVIQHSNGSVGFLVAGGVGLLGALLLIGWWWTTHGKGEPSGGTLK